MMIQPAMRTTERIVRRHSLRHSSAAVCVLVMTMLSPERMRAQATDAPVTLALADRGPRFYYAPDVTRHARHDATNASIFRRRLSLALQGATVPAALEEVARQAGITFIYRADILPRTAQVTLRAEDITVRAALTEILAEGDLDVELAADGRVGLVRRPSSAQQQAPAITGRVTDVATHAPLDQVSVRVEGSALGGVTAGDGRYAVRNIPPGTYRLTARRVGYTLLSKTIMVTPDSSATMDFALVAAATRLNEVVTTALGTQRRYEVGNTIATINADSIAPTAPITSLTDLISARAPGVEVEETNGVAGGGEAIRIRGLTSLALQNDPILIVDGVRQDNAAGTDMATLQIGSGSAHTMPSRLNDLDFSDVATIDVLKGPAASTEYGTDAANGVIVITTKHGSAGHPQWRLSAEQAMSEIPVHFADGYYSWGHTTDGTNTPVDCPQVALPGAYAVSNHTCAVDSVTKWSPLNHSAYSIFGTGHRARYDLSVSGGSDAVRYFVSGGLANNKGILQLPPAFKNLATNAGITLPRTEFDPNTEDQRSLRANTAIRLGSTADLAATGSFLSTYQRTPEMGYLLWGAVYGPAINNAAHFYGYDAFGGGLVNPLGELGVTGSQRTDRFVGGLTGNWRPAAWLSTHATVGIDHGSQGSTDLSSPGLGAYASFNAPALGQATEATDLYTVDLRATTTSAPMHAVRSNTSAGLQIVDNRRTGQTATVTGITLTNETLNGYANPIVAQLSNRAATLGGYGEEQLAFADRLFLTGALRIDAGSGFGATYHQAVYPKASVSFLALQDRATTLRIRGAFGEAGVQPDNGASFPLYQLTTIWNNGQAMAGAQLSWPGNRHLGPERTAEFEGGADLGLWGDRVSLEFTAYAKRTQDALVNNNLGEDLGNYVFQENIGTVRNTGVEGTLTAGLVQTGSVTWDVTLNGTLNRNRLVSLAPGVGAQIAGDLGFGFPNVAQIRQVAGFPLYGWWSRRASYTDLNHDGLIETNEITIADSASYLGASQPTQQASLATHVGLWHGTVAINALADYRGGYRMYNEAMFNEEYVKNQREGNDPTAPLAAQARYAAVQLFNGSLFVSDGTFVRFRELGVTYTLPARLTHRAHMASLALTGAVRNLALWTRYTGPDPEVSNPLGNNVQQKPTTGGLTANNDLRVDFGAVPLTRSFVLRLTGGW